MLEDTGCFILLYKNKKLIGLLLFFWSYSQSRSYMMWRFQVLRLRSKHSFRRQMQEISNLLCCSRQQLWQISVTSLIVFLFSTTFYNTYIWTCWGCISKEWIGSVVSHLSLPHLCIGIRDCGGNINVLTKTKRQKFCIIRESGILYWWTFLVKWEEHKEQWCNGLQHVKQDICLLEIMIQYKK